MDQQKLLDSFNKTAAGKVIAGKEAFRNRIGRIMHGLAYKYPKSVITAGALAFTGGLLTGSPLMIATAPLMFGAAYTAVSPRNTERATCEFLANVAVHKADAFARFLKRQNLSTTEKEQAILQYLQQNMPIGMASEYLKSHPQAVTHIINSHPEEACYHTLEVYRFETLQEQFTKNKDKGGILHGFIQTFTKKYRRQKQLAEKIATTRWQNRQRWEKMPTPKVAWTAFMRATEAPQVRTPARIGTTLAHSRQVKATHTPKASGCPKAQTLPTSKGR